MPKSKPIAVLQAQKGVQIDYHYVFDERNMAAKIKALEADKWTVKILKTS